MNHRGQTLILFLFLLPILSFLFLLFYQIGTIQLEQKQLENAVKETVNYGIHHWSEEDVEENMIQMFQESFSNMDIEDIEITKETGEIIMTVSKKYEIVFIKEHTIRVSYIGTNINGNIQIEKE